MKKKPHVYITGKYLWFPLVSCVDVSLGFCFPNGKSTGESSKGMMCRIFGRSGSVNPSSRRKPRIYEKIIQNMQGLVPVPFWEYWTSPYSSHGIDHIPNGWVMFNGDI